jgi:hypothetical protein
MVLYNTNKTRAIVIQDISYMENYDYIIDGEPLRENKYKRLPIYELRVNNEIIKRYENKQEIGNIVANIIDAMLENEYRFELDF